jgi:hypothetical protein
VAGAGAGNLFQSWQQGSNPAVEGATSTVTYTRSGYPIVSGSIVGTEEGTALATPGQAALLQLSTSFNSSSPNPGQIVGAVQPISVSADAYWNNVAAIVSGQNGQAPPSSIRIEFRINYQSPSLIDQYGLTPYYSPTLPQMGQALAVNGGSMTLTEAGASLQPGEPVVQAQPDGSLTGTFHLDLPLSATGKSQLFSLALSSDLEMLQIMTHWTSNLKDTMSLSIAGIYLPDGTPISAAGYNVTLDSGEIPPVVPTPEPATAIASCLLAAWGAAILRRSQRGLSRG